jgi:hypothetical protein
VTDQQSYGLTKRAALAALPWAGGLVAVLIVTGFVPCCGLIVFPAGAFGIAYYLTPRLGVYPTPETKSSLALNIGLGIGLAAMGSLVIATLIGQLLGLLFTSMIGALQRDLSSLAFGLSFSLAFLFVYLAVAIAGGTVIGILCAYLGSLLGLDQVRPAQYY